MYNHGLVRYGRNRHPISIFGFVFLIFVLFSISEVNILWFILMIIIIFAIISSRNLRNRSYISRSRRSSYKRSSNSDFASSFEDKKPEKDIDLYQNSSTHQLNQDQLSENSSRFKRNRSSYEKSSHKEFFCGFCGNPVVVPEESSGEFYCPYCGEKNRV